MPLTDQSLMWPAKPPPPQHQPSPLSGIHPLRLCQLPQAAEHAHAGRSRTVTLGWRGALRPGESVMGATRGSRGGGPPRRFG